MRVYRLCPKTGQKQFPVRNQDGFFVLGSPKRGNEKHHEKNHVLARSEDDLIDLLRQGYSVRVETPAAPSLVRLNLFVDGEALT